MSRRRRQALAALLGYAVVAFLAYGVHLLLEPGHRYVGGYDDPQIPIWSFAWWPHAILHGENPLVTHAVWAPSGVDLVWVNTVPPIALALAPITWIAGPVASYNVAAILLPALGAWAAFLLCRHVTGTLWPSLVGGYLFGFSSYMLGHVSGQPQLTAVFLIPLLALLVLRFVEGEIGARRLAVLGGLAVGAQMYLSLEVAFTVTFALAAALVLAFLLVRERRERLLASIRPLLAAYGLAAVVGAPLLYYALTDLRRAGFTPPDQYTSDLTNLVVPTHVEASGAGWAHTIAGHFPGNSSEQGVFLGLPLLVVLALYGWERRRSPAGRFLGAGFLLATYVTLGPHLTVYGHRLVPLPTPFGHNQVHVPGIGSKYIPLFDNTLPVRFALYSSLAAAVAVALWAASSTSRRIRIALPALGVLVLLPNPTIWATRYSVPALFTAARYRPCLPAGSRVLPEPIAGGGQAMLWQAVGGFHFDMAGGRLQTSPPSPFQHPPDTAQIALGNAPVSNQPELLTRYFRTKGVTDAIVDTRYAGVWAPALDRISKRHEVGGVLLYPVSGSLPAGCPSS